VTKGRPTVFTQEIADRICGRIALGESLRSVCRDDEMPQESTVRHWAVSNYNGFFAQYARARELQVEAWADEIVEISDEGTNDWMVKQLRDGHIEKLPDHEHITRSRLRVDTRKWLMSKLKPAVYGDKLQHANAAGDGNTEMLHRIERVIIDPKDRDG
jgi:hypothetical protein